MMVNELQARGVMDTSRNGVILCAACNARLWLVRVLESGMVLTIPYTMEVPSYDQSEGLCPFCGQPFKMEEKLVTFNENTGERKIA